MLWDALSAGQNSNGDVGSAIGLDFAEFRRLPNVIEAVAFSKRRHGGDKVAWYDPVKVPAGVQQLFNDPKCRDLAPQSDPFWIVLRALKEFVESRDQGDGKLPQQGLGDEMPDMHASTERYLALKQVYRDKARRDLEMVIANVRLFESRLRRMDGKEDSSSSKIPEEYIAEVCQNSHHLRVVRPCSSRTIGADVMQQQRNHCAAGMCLYALLEHASGGTNVAARPQRQGDNNNNDDDDDNVHYFRCNYYYQPMVAFVAGAGAQEITKLLTSHHTPTDNVFVFDGMQNQGYSFYLP
ncbi:NEDD8-activating enzyme E1 regulatory subunit [Spiromyces aspiralis]|uniref:NEDD8-activating enzyme E1 regulatory subunit n=1 Tax=Spiromyces aspiralis TaxID=68401 RepID=A0ACC1HUH4_9FUNG|nr:NEDD8-activating enzyme E1 regulatory subunit [Spiromyces aspiralis]